MFKHIRKLLFGPPAVDDTLKDAVECPHCAGSGTRVYLPMLHRRVPMRVGCEHCGQSGRVTDAEAVTNMRPK